MSDGKFAMHVEQTAERFAALVQAAAAADAALRDFELLAAAPVDGGARLDFLVRLRARLADVSRLGLSQGAERVVSSRLAEQDREIDLLQQAGHFTTLLPRWRFADFQHCARVERDALGYTRVIVYATDLAGFPAGKMLLDFLSARAVSLPSVGGAEFTVLVRTTGGVDHLFVVRDTAFGRHYQMFDGAQVCEHTAAVHAEQDRAEAAERERRDVERAAAEQREHDLDLLIGKLSDPAAAAKVREALGV
jgi:hypothetical protein